MGDWWRYCTVLVLLSCAVPRTPLLVLVLAGTRSDAAGEDLCCRLPETQVVQRIERSSYVKVFDSRIRVPAHAALADHPAAVPGSALLQRCG